jgi:hypothetical protein
VSGIPKLSTRPSRRSPPSASPPIVPAEPTGYRLPPPDLFPSSPSLAAASGFARGGARGVVVWWTEGGRGKGGLGEFRGSGRSEVDGGAFSPGGVRLREGSGHPRHWARGAVDDQQ